MEVGAFISSKWWLEYFNIKDDSKESIFLKEFVRSVPLDMENQSTIVVDAKRTRQLYSAFNSKTQNHQESLIRVLTAYCKWKKIGLYKQGFHEIAAPFYFLQPQLEEHLIIQLMDAFISKILPYSIADDILTVKYMSGLFSEIGMIYIALSWVISMKKKILSSKSEEMQIFLNNPFDITMLHLSLQKDQSNSGKHNVMKEVNNPKLYMTLEEINTHPLNINILFDEVNYFILRTPPSFLCKLTGCTKYVSDYICQMKEMSMDRDDMFAMRKKENIVSSGFLKKLNIFDKSKEGINSDKTHSLHLHPILEVTHKDIEHFVYWAERREENAAQSPMLRRGDLSDKSAKEQDEDIWFKGRKEPENIFHLVYLYNENEMTEDIKFSLGERTMDASLVSENAIRGISPCKASTPSICQRIEKTNERHKNRITRFSLATLQTIGRLVNECFDIYQKNIVRGVFTLFIFRDLMKMDGWNEFSLSLGELNKHSKSLPFESLRILLLNNIPGVVVMNCYNFAKDKSRSRVSILPPAVDPLQKKRETGGNTDCRKEEERGINFGQEGIFDKSGEKQVMGITDAHAGRFALGEGSMATKPLENNKERCRIERKYENKRLGRETEEEGSRDPQSNTEVSSVIKLASNIFSFTANRLNAVTEKTIGAVSTLISSSNPDMISGGLGFSSILKSNGINYSGSFLPQSAPINQQQGLFQAIEKHNELCLKEKNNFFVRDHQAQDLLKDDINISKLLGPDAPMTIGKSCSLPFNCQNNIIRSPPRNDELVDGGKVIFKAMEVQGNEDRAESECSEMPSIVKNNEKNNVRNISLMDAAMSNGTEETFGDLWASLNELALVKETLYSNDIYINDLIEHTVVPTSSLYPLNHTPSSKVLLKVPLASNYSAPTSTFFPEIAATSSKSTIKTIDMSPFPQHNAHDHKERKNSLLSGTSSDDYITQYLTYTYRSSEDLSTALCAEEPKNDSKMLDNNNFNLLEAKSKGDGDLLQFLLPAESSNIISSSIKIEVPRTLRRDGNAYCEALSHSTTNEIAGSKSYGVLDIHNDCPPQPVKIIDKTFNPSNYSLENIDTRRSNQLESKFHFLMDDSHSMENPLLKPFSNIDQLCLNQESTIITNMDNYHTNKIDFNFDELFDQNPSPI